MIKRKSHVSKISGLIRIHGKPGTGSAIVVNRDCPRYQKPGTGYPIIAIFKQRNSYGVENMHPPAKATIAQLLRS